MISDMRLIKYMKARPGFLGFLAGLALGDVDTTDCPLAVLIKKKAPCDFANPSWFDSCWDAIVRGRLTNRELNVSLTRVIRWFGGNARKSLLRSLLVRNPLRVVLATCDSSKRS